MVKDAPLAILGNRSGNDILTSDQPRLSSGMVKVLTACLSRVELASRQAGHSGASTSPPSNGLHSNGSRPADTVRVARAMLVYYRALGHLSSCSSDLRFPCVSLWMGKLLSKKNKHEALHCQASKCFHISIFRQSRQAHSHCSTRV